MLRKTHKSASFFSLDIENIHTLEKTRTIECFIHAFKHKQVFYILICLSANFHYVTSKLFKHNAVLWQH